MISMPDRLAGVNYLSWCDQVNARTGGSVVETRMDITAETHMLKHVVSADGTKVLLFWRSSKNSQINIVEA